MCGKIGDDKIRNGNMRKIIEIAPLIEKIMNNKTKWFRHVEKNM